MAQIILEGLQQSTTKQTSGRESPAAGHQRLEGFHGNGCSNLADIPGLSGR